MNKEEYKKFIDEHYSDKSKEILNTQYDLFFEALDNFKLPKHGYSPGDKVKLKKGTLLHGTFRNFEGLKNIAKNGLIASEFIGERKSKYPSAVSVWNLKQDYVLRDYIDFYSGGTIRYSYFGEEKESKTEVIPFSEMSEIMINVIGRRPYRWDCEQTKESRFMPSISQSKVQIGIIFNSDNDYIRKILLGDILNTSIDDEIVRDFVNEKYYPSFIEERINKDDFFTDREIAILFGVPPCFIEGILVGREYEKNDDMLKQIKNLLPECYICNLDGIVIVE